MKIINEIAVASISSDTDANEPEVTEVTYNVSKQWIAQAILELVQSFERTLKQIVNPRYIDRINGSIKEYRNFVSVDIPISPDRKDTTHNFDLYLDRSSAYNKARNRFRILFRPDTVLDENNIEDYIDLNHVFDTLKDSIHQIVLENPSSFENYLHQEPENPSDYTIEELEEMQREYFNDLQSNGLAGIASFLGDDFLDYLINNFVDAEELERTWWDLLDGDFKYLLGDGPIELPSGAYAYCLGPTLIANKHD